MDPITINRLGNIRQQEILDTAMQTEGEPVIQHLMQQVGRSLVTLGQKMIDSANPTTLEAQTAPAQVCAENC
jgi:hypothetical protein